jgi:hypothetical protein
LHAQLDSICARLPDSVEPVIIALKRTHSLKISLAMDRFNTNQFNQSILILKPDPREAKTSLTKLNDLARRDLVHLVAEDPNNGLGNGLSKPNAQSNRVLPGDFSYPNSHSAVQFSAKIQDQFGILIAQLTSWQRIATGYIPSGNQVFAAKGSRFAA